MTITRSPGPGRQQGRTLLELLISITIGLVILGALIAIYLSTHSSSRQSAAVSRMNEDASIALNLLGTQLRMAGFSPPRIHMTPGAALVDGVLVSVPDRNFVGAGIRGCDHGFVSHTTDDFENLACAGGTSGAAAFAIRFEGSNPLDTNSDGHVDSADDPKAVIARFSTSGPRATVQTSGSQVRFEGPGSLSRSGDRTADNKIGDLGKSSIGRQWRQIVTPPPY
jgi:Tfp pilus assembly protein PilW